jgi:DNA-directed RNA polymerase subunit RPC12/RpoP
MSLPMPSGRPWCMRGMRRCSVQYLLDDERGPWPGAGAMTKCMTCDNEIDPDLQSMGSLYCSTCALFRLRKHLPLRMKEMRAERQRRHEGRTK